MDLYTRLTGNSCIFHRNGQEPNNLGNLVITNVISLLGGTAEFTNMGCDISSAPDF